MKEARKTKLLISMDNLIKRENFDLVISAARSVAGASTSMAKTVKRLIGFVTMVKYGHALREDDYAKLQEANDFKALMDTQWKHRYNVQ